MCPFRVQELGGRLARMSRKRFLFPWEQSTRERLQRERDAAVRDAIAAAIDWKRHRAEQIAAAREEEAAMRAEMVQFEAERDRAAVEGAFGELRAVLNHGNPQLVAEAEAFMVSLLNQLNLGEQQGHQQQPLESSAPPPPPPPPPPQQQQPLPQSSYGPDSLQTAFVGTVRLLVF